MQETTEKSKKQFKLSLKDREYHKNKAREKRGGWKCDSCGNPNPIHRDIATKKKLCLSCAINDCRLRVQEREKVEMGRDGIQNIQTPT
jgi:hypothetical protein